MQRPKADVGAPSNLSQGFYLGLDTHLMRRMSELTDFDQSEFLADVYYPEMVGPEPLVHGRLRYSIEGGGKRRIFPIGNYVIQRLLRPFHD